MNKVTYIIVDDERLARVEMKLMMSKFIDFHFVGEASNATAAEMLITTLQPNLIFLDIQMPERSGFDLLAALPQVPEVIFTTAFDHYAVKAFDLNAIDYLVKPIRHERLVKAIEKVNAKFNSGTSNGHLFIKEGDKIHFITISTIHVIESIGNYARLHFDAQKVFFKRSLNQLEKILDPNLFFRINRSIIINRSFIKKIERLPNGRLTFTLKNDENYIVSSRQSALFKSQPM